MGPLATFLGIMTLGSVFFIFLGNPFLLSIERVPPRAGSAAVVIGGTSGLGGALARALTKYGYASVTTTSRAPQSDNVLEYAAGDPLSANLKSAIRTARAVFYVPGFAITRLDRGARGKREQETEAMLRVNFLGAVSVLEETVRLWDSNPGNGEHRHITFIGSTLAYTGCPGYAGYAASKFALRGYLDSRRHELEREGVFVHLVSMGNFDSPGYRQEQLLKPQALKDLEASAPLLTTEGLAPQIVGAAHTWWFEVGLDWFTRAHMPSWGLVSVLRLIQRHLFRRMLESVPQDAANLVQHNSPA